MERVLLQGMQAGIEGSSSFKGSKMRPIMWEVELHSHQINLNSVEEYYGLINLGTRLMPTPAGCCEA